jgi:amino acid adenylation domain-containing protein
LQIHHLFAYRWLHESNGGSDFVLHPDDTPPGKRLDDWFRDGLDRNPHGPALRIHDRSWSYLDVDRTARSWAATLIAAPGGPARRVGILASKSEQAYIGFLAALYAGAVAVPLGPETPVERNRLIATMAGVDALVVDAAGTGQLDAITAAVRPRVLLAPGIGPSDLAAPQALRPPDGSADDLAYILFTSGSTGQPKGVPIAHRNASAFLAAMLPRYDVGPGDTFSQIYELTFDLSVFEVWMAWASGACVRSLSRLQALNPVKHLTRYGVTVATNTPSLVTSLRAADMLPPGSLPGVRYTVFCGEALTVETARYWRRAAPYTVLDNLYGPTELTVSCTAHRWPSGTEVVDPASPTVPVGLPNDGLDYLLLDGDGTVDPRSGELCVTGPQMFDGYLDPAADKGRFVTVDGRRWYRTGDRMRLDENVGLIYLDRTDGQVKVRGYRVELAEVEAAVRDATGGAEVAAVAVDGPEGVVLVAFVLGRAPVDLDAATRALTGRLPGYMVPSQVWPIPDIPLTTNGKTDRSALRTQARHRLVTATAGTATAGAATAPTGR